MKLNQFELGYFAGILEGEGCFEARENDTDNGLDLTITIGSDSSQLTRWLKNKIGGKVVIDNHNKGFTWISRKDDILEILKTIEPLLIFKKQQCNSMIRLMELLKKPYSGIKLENKELNERQITYLEHKGLINEPHEINKKGRENQKVLLALSGGADSCTLLYYLIWKGLNPEVISFNYGQKHLKEIEYATKTCKELNIKQDIVDISFLKNILKSSLTTKEQKIPKGHYEKESMKQTVVPSRNSIILTILAGIAISRKIPNIAFGAHASDSTIYPDCRPIFSYLIEEVIRKGNWEQISVLSPFLSFKKQDIIFLGNILNVPYKNTWSCYVGKQKPCGKCGTCRERLEAFELNNLIDPLEYEQQ